MKRIILKAKFKPKSGEFKNLRERLEKKFNRVVNDSYVKTETDKVILNMKATIRSLGKGIDKNGKRYKLPPLKDSTIDYRDLYESNLAAGTKPERSNLTGTGQLIDALKNVAKQRKIIIELSENRKIELSGATAKKTNKEIKEYLEEKGFIFFNIPQSEIDRIKRELRKALLTEYNK